MPGTPHMTSVGLQTHWAETDKDRWSNSLTAAKPTGQPPGKAKRDLLVLALELPAWPPVGQGHVHVVGEGMAPPSTPRDDPKPTPRPFSLSPSESPPDS